MPLFHKRSRTYNLVRKFAIHKTEVFDSEYPTNFISTSKYTVISFLPKSLLYQFRRYANIYFLMIAILQTIPTISPLNPFTAVAPFAFVIGLSMLRELYEDIQRHKSDIEINASKTIKIIRDNNEKKTISWAEIQVGNILFIQEDEQIPADLIILNSNLENGACFIQTSSLDGEKNLKPKNPIKETISLFNFEIVDKIKEIFVSAQSPDQNLYSFEGSLELEKNKLFLGPKQLLLRGSKLRNTKWIIGLVVYTGMDTKIMRNAEISKQKTSNMEKKTNKLIIYLLMLQIFCAMICAIMNLAFNLFTVNNSFYLHISYSAQVEGFINFWSYFLLFNTMLPISLIVSLEFVKIFQGYFISQDQDIYTKHNQRPCKVVTTTINEELGQVEYVFSDKTGTLTCNKMEFKIAVIGPTTYGEDKLGSKEGYKIMKKMNKVPSAQHMEAVFAFNAPALKTLLMSRSALEDDITFKNKIPNKNENDSCSLNNIPNDMIESEKSGLAHEYWQILATCHECIVEKNKETNDIYYQGQSPDEITLVDAAKNMNYKFLGVHQNVINLEIYDHVKKMELYFLFEFDSDRKRMSVIVNDHNKYKMYIKGADNVIKERLSQVKSQPFLKFTEKKLDEFSKKGLRTLLIAMKEFKKEEFEIIYKQYKSLVDKPNRDKLMAEFAETIEKDLILIGATAIEDKLQEGVPETIKDLLRADIKVWMLTGDKLETADNIARSCKLIQQDMSLLIFSEKTDSELKSRMIENKERYELCIQQKKKKSLLIEGQTLSLVLASDDLKKTFLEISQGCESVVCCRVTPKQKAEVVRLIKNNLNKITLAIGDGANDVNMIQEAHIGIGIYGNEGMRAVQSSDFAIGEFKCIWKLLLVHGRWCYVRTSNMILYFFYKNMIFTIPHFFFSFLCGSSAQTLFDDWYISFYNLFFTALPLIIRAIFEQDVNHKFKNSFPKNKTQEKNEDVGGSVLIDNKVKNSKNKKVPLFSEDVFIKRKIPLLYEVGQKQTIFTNKKFISWVFLGIFQSVILFIINYFTFVSVILSEKGYNSDLWSFSVTYFTSIILTVDLKMALNTSYWLFLNWICLILCSVILYFAYFFYSNFIITYWVFNAPLFVVKTLHFYASVLLGILFLFSIDYLILFIPTIIEKKLIYQLKLYCKQRNIENEKVKNGQITDDIKEKLGSSEKKDEINEFAIESGEENYEDSDSGGAISNYEIKHLSNRE